MALVETCAATPNDKPISREGKTGKLVTQFREILLWPLQLMPLKEGLQIHHHWELLRDWTGSPWDESRLACGVASGGMRVTTKDCSPSSMMSRTVKHYSRKQPGLTS